MTAVGYDFISPGRTCSSLETVAANGLVVVAQTRIRVSNTGETHVR